MFGIVPWLGTFGDRRRCRWLCLTRHRGPCASLGCLPGVTPPSPRPCSADPSLALVWPRRGGSGRALPCRVSPDPLTPRGAVPAVPHVPAGQHLGSPPSILTPLRTPVPKTPHWGGGGRGRSRSASPPAGSPQQDDTPIPGNHFGNWDRGSWALVGFRRCFSLPQGRRGMGPKPLSHPGGASVFPQGSSVRGGDISQPRRRRGPDPAPSSAPLPFGAGGTGPPQRQPPPRAGTCPGSPCQG